MDWPQIAETAGRAVIVYMIMLAVIRLLGKRTVGNFTAFDLLVALMLGEVVDEIIYGDVTMAQGMTAILVVAAAKYATQWLTYTSPALNKILEGKPTEIVRHGELVPGALRSEMMHELEALAALRLQGVSDLREVKTAVLEVDGEISVLKEDPSKKPNDEPPREKRTDTPEALGAA